jgi:hypothetical protein
MPVVDLSCDASDNLIGKRLAAVPTDRKGKHADFPPR